MKIKQSPEVSAAEFVDSLVIFNLRNHHSYILNDTARLIWDFCKKPRDLNQIVRLIQRKYGVNFFKIKKDAGRLIRQLEKRELIVCR